MRSFAVIGSTLLLISTAAFGQTPQKATGLPGHVKLVPGFAAQPRPRLLTPLPSAGRITVQPGTPSRCGHIRVVPADPALDPKMVLPQRRDGFTSNMPLLEAAPPCGYGPGR